MTDAERFDNNCARYTYLEGYEPPHSHGSCMGCKYSNDPTLYDAGCGHPDGFLSRFPKPAAQKSETEG